MIDTKPIHRVQKWLGRVFCHATHGIIAQLVNSVAGKLKNIPDAYNCADFNQEVDRKSGFRTR